MPAKPVISSRRVVMLSRIIPPRIPCGFGHVVTKRGLAWLVAASLGIGAAGCDNSGRPDPLLVYTAPLWVPAALICAAANCAGCRKLADRATPVDPQSVKVGETTKEDVIQRLGNPDTIWTDDRVFAYGPGPTPGGDAGRCVELLLIQFDEGDRVRRMDRMQKRAGVELGDFLKAWAKGGANGNT